MMTMKKDSTALFGGVSNMGYNLDIIEKEYSDTSDSQLINQFCNHNYLVSVASPINELEEIKIMKFLLPVMALEIKRRDIIKMVKGKKKQKEVEGLVAKYVLLVSSGEGVKN